MTGDVTDMKEVKKAMDAIAYDPRLPEDRTLCPPGLCGRINIVCNRGRPYVHGTIPPDGEAIRCAAWGSLVYDLKLYDPGKEQCKGCGGMDYLDLTCPKFKECAEYGPEHCLLIPQGE